jgi:hypothetical protein
MKMAGCKLLPAKQLCSIRTGVRVAEGAGLENRYTGNGIVGSNPTLSAAVRAVGEVAGAYAGHGRFPPNGNCFPGRPTLPHSLSSILHLSSVRSHELAR